jgi:osmotically-inducible protein OsmY
MRSRLLFSIAASAFLAVSCAQSDVAITASVKGQLAADELVKARRIDVDTRNRVVTLSGEVESEEEEAKALQIARSASGVADVVDQLTVVPEPKAAPTTGIGGAPTEPGGGPLTNDSSISSAVKATLLADPDTSGLRIDVDTKNRVVTLTGTVSTQAERAEALEIARKVKGVTGVRDRLTVEGQ